LGPAQPWEGDVVFGWHLPVIANLSRCDGLCSAGQGVDFTEDCVFYEPRGTYHGRDEIHRIAGAIKATHPDFRYQPIVPPEELGNGGRVQWVSGRPGEAPEYAGTDFIIARDGRIAAVYLFFDKLS
jgi:SnoaL-like domain